MCSGIQRNCIYCLLFVSPIVRTKRLILHAHYSPRAAEIPKAYIKALHVPPISVMPGFVSELEGSISLSGFLVSSHV